MQKIENPEFSRLMLNHLADLYNIKQKREGIHLSTLVYCITRSFFDQVNPVEPTDQEVLLFSLGYGLQDVLTPSEATTPVYNKDGITYRPDFQLKLTDATVELKTTRMSSNREEFPETWIEYIKGGCYILGIREYELSVLFMLGNYRPPFPEIKSYKLVFDEQELLANWEYLVKRRDIYVDALEKNKPPKPFLYSKDWECKNCRYKLQCQAIEMANKLPPNTELKQNAVREEDWD